MKQITVLNWLLCDIKSTHNPPWCGARICMVWIFNVLIWQLWRNISFLNSLFNVFPGYIFLIMVQHIIIITTDTVYLYMHYVNMWHSVIYTLYSHTIDFFLCILTIRHHKYTWHNISDPFTTIWQCIICYHYVMLPLLIYDWALIISYVSVLTIIYLWCTMYDVYYMNLYWLRM